MDEFRHLGVGILFWSIKKYIFIVKKVPSLGGEEEKKREGLSFNRKLRLF
jgi:hypothetical protein